MIIIIFIGYFLIIYDSLNIHKYTLRQRKERKSAFACDPNVARQVERQVDGNVYIEP